MRPGYDEVRRALSDQYDGLVEAFRDLDPSGPTDCAGWTVEDLETHVAITARGLARIAAKDTDGPATAGVDDWAKRLPGLSAEIDEMAKGERLSLAPQASAVAEALREHPHDKVVEQLTGRHTLHDAAVFRLVEAVVHGLDVAVAPRPEALRIVVTELADAFATTHPGGAVELRIPPYTHVNCVAGTQGSVVVVEPVAWLRLCAGREAWADLVRAGRVRASGEGADLSGLLPLLG